MTKLQKQRNILLAKMLESKKYKQGRTCLRSKNNKYCCLGVACELYRLTTKKGKWKFGKLDDPSLDDKTWYFQLNKNKDDLMPPETIANWYGWCRLNPILGSVPATDLNDSLKKSFSFIAKKFRELAEGLTEE